MGKLKEALKTFVQESCQFLAGQPRELRQWIRVVRKDNGFSFPMDRRPDFSNAIMRLQQRIHDTGYASFDRCFEIVQHDPRLRSVLLVDGGGKPIEDDQAARWWLANIFTGNLVRAYVNRANSTHFDENVFKRLLEELNQETESSYWTIVEFSPLMKTEIAPDQIQIEPGIRLRQIENGELEDWVNADRYIPLMSSPLPFGGIIDLKCGIEVEYRQSRHSTESSQLEAHNKVQHLVTALRLLTHGFPRIAFTERHASSLLALGSSRSWSPSLHTGGSLTKIDKTREQELVALYAKLGHSLNTDKAALALARWNSAGDKLTQEDKLVDYWIALESLFVPETEQELSFRVALRIAAFLGEDGSERRQIYDDIRDSYRLRSKIVRGSASKRKTKRTAAELTDLTRSHLRRTLLKILESDQSFTPEKLETQLLLK